MMNIYDFFKEINRSYDLSNSDISQYYWLSKKQIIHFFYMSEKKSIVESFDDIDIMRANHFMPLLSNEKLNLNMYVLFL